MTDIGYMYAQTKNSSNYLVLDSDNVEISNNLIVGNDLSVTDKLGVNGSGSINYGNSGQVLKSQGSSAPIWANETDTTYTGGQGVTINGSNVISIGGIIDQDLRTSDTPQFNKVGIGLAPSTIPLNVQSGVRSGFNPTHTPVMYVTGGLGRHGQGVEFRHSNQTQGVGIGFAGIYATGDVLNQDLSIMPKGSGSTYVYGFVNASDDRLKSDESLIENAVETIMKLRPQIYNMNEELNVISDNPTREAGLIAQEVYYDCPELRFLVRANNDGIDAEPVTIPPDKPFTDDDPSKDPDYSGWGTGRAGLKLLQLIPYLIKGMQEQQAEINNLKSRLEQAEL